MTEPTKGYVVVASRHSFFYRSALNLMHSIRDFDPDAKIAFTTEERFCDGGENVADFVYYCDNHVRAKLWGMAKSPFDISFYIDGDCEVQSPEISTVFDRIEQSNLQFTALPDERSWQFMEHDWPAGKFSWCGAVCLYDMRDQLVREFMKNWYELTVEMMAGRWWPLKEDGSRDYDNYPSTLGRWDQFSLWWLLNKEQIYQPPNIRVSRLDNFDDWRWNYFTGYKDIYNFGKEPIIYHYSSCDAKLDYMRTHDE